MGSADEEPCNPTVSIMLGHIMVNTIETTAIIPATRSILGWKGLASSMVDPPLISARSANIPRSVLPNPPAPESTPAHKSAPESTPAHKCTPECQPSIETVRTSAQRSKRETVLHDTAPESTPESAPASESAPVSATTPESTPENTPESAPTPGLSQET